MVKLALLWHMHQPYYEDLATGEHILPWVRLHAIKDYWGMVSLLREFPAVKVTFNLVPSLLVQVEAFAADRAHDRHLLAGLAPAAALDEAERRFLVAQGFHAAYDRMIRPYPRYAELHARRLDPDSFSVADLRDLQVLHKLVWMDPDWMRTDERLTRLIEKQQDYTEADKQTLREVELALLRDVIPAYRRAASTGRVELSTSPFYHPILPLLCDSDVHLQAQPHSEIPRRLFARPEDAEAQLIRAFDYHARLFGSRPRGVWPSEGSVSDEVIRLLARQGCEWTATDEEILSRSLRRALSADDLYRAYRVGSAPDQVEAVFRDHQLSDLIGFAYQSWDTATAAEDFLNRVRDAGRRFAAENGGEVATVAVILDGENAWEYYPGGGRPFLRALYQRLQEADDIETVTMHEAASGASRELPSVFPGSWINGDFYIWAGHKDDHRAWAQVAAARQALAQAGPGVSAEALATAAEELYIAEGSDWFWWYGDDHSSDHDREFDDLFRRHLRNVYRALDQPVPDELHATNISTSPVGPGPVMLGLPTTPPVDGRAGNFARWASGVEIPLSGGGGTMHQVAAPLVRSMRLAADGESLYLRLDGAELVRRLGRDELRLAVQLDRPRRERFQLGNHDQQGPRYAAREVVSIAVPFDVLGAQPGDQVGMSILITDAAGDIVAQLPVTGPFAFEVPTREHAARLWVV